MGEIYAQASVLCATAATGTLIAIAIGKRTGFLSFRVMAILTYTLVIPVSGVVHLLRNSDSKDPGPFDALNRLDPGQMANLILVAGSGLAALVIGALIALPSTKVKKQTAPLTGDDRKILPFFVAAILPLSIWAWLRTQEYVAGLDVYGGRIISVGGGNARFAFIAYWSVWALSLGVIWYVLQRREAKPLLTAMLFFVGAAGCSALVGWSGGRADALLAPLPMVLVLLPLVRVGQLTTVVFGLIVVIGGSWQVAELTARRAAQDPYGTGGLADFVDWQFGRFSMLGWATQYTEQTGFLYGETLVNGSQRFLSGFQKLLGLPPSEFVTRASQRVATEDLDRTSAGVLDYINPSVVSEMYLNFGFLGVVAICLMIGSLSGYCDRRFVSSETAVVQLAWAFVGVSVTVYAQITELTAPLSAVLFRGAPLMAIAAVSSFAARSKSVTEPLVAEKSRRQ